MANIGGIEHENLLHETLDELAKNGYRVIELKGKCPDGIAVKDDKIIAVEILGKSYKKNQWKFDRLLIQKKDTYRMFDDVLIRTFKRPKTKKKDISDIEIVCNECDNKMIFESNNGHVAIFICELCEREVKAISIGK